MNGDLSRRMRVLRAGPGAPGPVVYWMSRDQRAEDNWALLHAVDQARARGTTLLVAFCLVPGFLGATRRQYQFMLKGLKELEGRLGKKGIGLRLLFGNPQTVLPPLLRELGAGLLVTDFDPLRLKLDWKRDVLAKTELEVHEVDAHNIVPCWIASPKREFSAGTFRPKLNRLLPGFLAELPTLKTMKHRSTGQDRIPWDVTAKDLKFDAGVEEVDWILPGEGAARSALRRFCSQGLPAYAEARNDPARSGQSGLSPYLHFGQLSAQRVALEVAGAQAPETSKAAFLEELTVRRELADNFCLYNLEYDRFGGFPAWARDTLDAHRHDEREYVYSEAELEGARTHDPLWNAAQTEMVERGKMHGYLRMYWAKKILEWTETPEEALRIAIQLNDRYELDGRDPNGYAGIAWSIGGVHDRAWSARRVFGKVRFMSFSGAKSKFEVQAYLDLVGSL